MQNYLLVDFGSTFTKLTAVDLEKEDISWWSLSPDHHFPSWKCPRRCHHQRRLHGLPRGEGTDREGPRGEDRLHVLRQGTF